MSHSSADSFAPTVSARLLWPFVRVAGHDPRAIAIVKREQVSPLEMVAHDARIAHSVAMRVLVGVVTELDDPELGLKAGACLLPGDMDVLHHAASASATLRGALDICCQYLQLVHGGAEFALRVEGELAMWSYQLRDGLDEPPAAHDFAVSSITTYARLSTGRDEPKIAVHFAHQDRTNLEAYRRMFRCPVRFGMEYTGVVFPASRLDWAQLHPSVELRCAFEAQARERLLELERDRATVSLVRQALLSILRGGEPSMQALARRLGMSVATLRRRLADERTTYSSQLNDVRRELALARVMRADCSADELSFLLRFAAPAAFHRAFKRWTGMTFSAYRRHALQTAEPQDSRKY